MRKQCLYIWLLLFVPVAGAFAQDSSLLKLLNDSIDVQGNHFPVTGTFKATQLVNLPTTESPARKNLQFLIMHRFGKLNDGAYALFGLDNAEIRFGLDYGITDRLSVGVGRSSYDKTFDGSLKYKVLQQSTSGMPVSLSAYGLVTHFTQRYSDKPYLNARFRTSYTTQLLLARKFNSNLSLLLAPAFTHINLVPTPQDKNDIFTVSAGGRYKITRRMAITAEYNYLFNNQVVSGNVSRSLSFGWDIETGGHVFQLVFSNSRGMIGPYYLAKNTGTWGNGDIYFGFNISRNFNWNKK
jgi:long-subunit fatty acid transport protein